jgi:hypothetical protein
MIPRVHCRIHKSTLIYRISLISNLISSRSRLDLPSVFFSSGFWIKILYSYRMRYRKSHTASHIHKPGASILIQCATLKSKGGQFAVCINVEFNLPQTKLILSSVFAKATIVYVCALTISSKLDSIKPALRIVSGCMHSSYWSLIGWSNTQ